MAAKPTLDLRAAAFPGRAKPSPATSARLARFNGALAERDGRMPERIGAEPVRSRNPLIKSALPGATLQTGAAPDLQHKKTKYPILPIRPEKETCRG